VIDCLNQAPRDSQFALTYVLGNVSSSEQQQAALNALKFKTDVLWAQLDALYFAYHSAWRLSPRVNSEEVAQVSVSGSKSSSWYCSSADDIMAVSL
jgi:hypothetical protein